MVIRVYRVIENSCPQLEYASTVWSPDTDQDTNKLESVQLQLMAARWVTHD